MKRLALVLFFTLGASVFADPIVKNEIKRLADAIYEQTDSSTASRRDLIRARNHLQNALDLVDTGGFWEVIQYGPGNGYQAPASCRASGHTTGCGTIANRPCERRGQRVAACDGYNRIDCVVECR